MQKTAFVIVAILSWLDGDYGTVALLFRVMPIGEGGRLSPGLQDIRYG